MEPSASTIRGVHARRKRSPVAVETVVHVVTEVGCDPRERRQRSGLEVRRELSQRDDLVAAIGVVADVGVVHERVVLHRVLTHEDGRRARCGHGLHIRLPGKPCLLELVHDVRAVDEARRAVAVDAVRAAGRQRDVVRQARMRDRVEPAQRHGAARERSEERGVRVRGHGSRRPLGSRTPSRRCAPVPSWSFETKRDSGRRRSVSGGVQRQERGGEHRRSDPHQWNGM